jgi:hypothetical protein
MPWLPQLSGGSLLTEPEEAEPADWFLSPQATLLTVQTLYQQDGYAMTLLVAETDDDDRGDAEFEDVFTRAVRFVR